MKKTISEKIERVKRGQTNSIELTYEYLPAEIFLEISKLLELRELKLLACNFTDIPDSLGNLIYLESFHLEDWGLDYLPPVITKLSSLKILSLRNNHNLKILPDEFAKLSELEKLFLSSTGFDVIPKVLSGLEKLKILDLSDTFATDYSVLKKIKNIEELHLYNSANLKVLNEISFLIKIKILNLACNIEYPEPDYYLEKFPDQLLDLINLENLNLSNNKISSLPNEIRGLSNLKEINLGGNNFHSFPVQLLELLNLEKISLSNNHLSDIPIGINKLKSLSSLNLKGNDFSEFPRRICELTNLHELNISKNPLTNTAMLFSYRFVLNKNFHARLKSENTRFDVRTFSFDSINFNLYLVENFAYLYEESGENEVFIEFQIYSNEYDEEGNFYEDESFLHIHIFGNLDTRKNILKIICKRIDEWFKNEQENIYKIQTFYRSFHFRTKDIKQNGNILIDYDELIELAKAGQNIYYDFLSKRKIPVKNLLDFIGIDEHELKKEREKKEWKGTSFLTEIKIENFKIFNHLEINLTEHFNIILGRNGLGKTSILQGITLGLLPLDNLDKSNDFMDYINMLHNNDKAEILLSWGEEYRRAYIFKNELNEEEYVNFPQKLILAYGVNLNTDPKLDHSKIVDNIINRVVAK